MCGAEELAAASPAGTRQPGRAARVERYEGDAVRRHGFGSTGIPACLPAGRPVPQVARGCDLRGEETLAAFLSSAGVVPAFLNLVSVGQASACLR